MLMKSITAGLVGSALFATAALAQQTPTAPSDTPAKSEMKAETLSPQSVQGDWRASKVVGLKVYNEANENVGSINDLLMEKGGNIKAAVIGVGGFLGMGEHLVAVPFDKLKFSNQPITYTGAQSTPSRPASTTTTGAATTTSPAASSSASKWYPDHAVFNTTKDELKKLPEFKYTE
ncbi:MAG: PRC-barrel domain-containing protein [Bradyrhizobium sp.]|uniref:PRC-barrel domain-containing protein n=1 Tax=Bradyrhizobium sp. TaxID=376 RepID=UPI0025C59D84|nr:PRC-barrel domain-containing protein [Bradyrhizobium sp.]MBI5265489.1 PRC-barrel domain-containing protein [Bradyrhizobium sp.]